jgi:hypothetical protein
VVATTAISSLSLTGFTFTSISNKVYGFTVCGY